jgi:hypothetical protein
VRSQTRSSYHLSEAARSSLFFCSESRSSPLIYNRAIRPRSRPYPGPVDHLLLRHLSAKVAAEAGAAGPLTFSIQVRLHALGVFAPNHSVPLNLSHPASPSSRHHPRGPAKVSMTFTLGTRFGGLGRFQAAHIHQYIYVCIHADCPPLGHQPLCLFLGKKYYLSPIHHNCTTPGTFCYEPGCYCQNGSWALCEYSAQLCLSHL